MVAVHVAGLAVPVQVAVKGEPVTVDGPVTVNVTVLVAGNTPPNVAVSLNVTAVLLPTPTEAGVADAVPRAKVPLLTVSVLAPVATAPSAIRLAVLVPPLPEYTLFSV
jgi:hypothetical protein